MFRLCPDVNRTGACFSIMVPEQPCLKVMFCDIVHVPQDDTRAQL